MSENYAITPPTRSLIAASALIVMLALCYGAAAVGGYFTSLSVSDWYPTLRTPAWTPSGAVIGAVWNVLYGLMAIAGWLVWRRRGLRGSPGALGLFLLQLVLNVGWSALFFGLQSPGAAAIEIWLLLAAIGATAVAFWRITIVGALLLLPYAGWVAFAGVLNVTIWWLNR